MRKLFKKYREYRLRKWVSKLAMQNRRSDFEVNLVAKQMYEWIKSEKEA